MPEPASERRRILVVDDHPVVREGLSRLIAQESDLIVCGEAAGRTEALRSLEQEHPDLVILDLPIAQGEGIEFIKTIRREYPGVTVLVLATRDETLLAERALRAGAAGFLSKQEASERVLTAIRSVLAGRMYVSDLISPGLIKRLLEGGALRDDPVMGHLSDRERQIFTMIGRGATVDGIARELDLSISSVDGCCSNIKEKLHLRDTRELTSCAVRWTVRRRTD